MSRLIITTGSIITALIAGYAFYMSGSGGIELTSADRMIAGGVIVVSILLLIGAAGDRIRASMKKR
ncbi:MAG: hypothetical protein ABEI52_01575 [Halobacteriaceae archaeon]